MASNQSLSTSQVEKAKEAITILSSILSPEQIEQGRPTTSTQVLASTGPTNGQQHKPSNARPPVDPDFETTRSKGLLKAADRALNALKGMKKGLKEDSGRKKWIKSEIASVFASSSKKPKKPAWKHRFVCPAWRDQPKIPTTDTEKDDLLEAGLGEKVIEFQSLDASGEELKEILYSEFPKLRDGGGFQLCRCIPNSRNLEELTAVSYSSVAMLKDRVGNTRTYIRPLQRDLDMDTVFGLPEGPKEECLTCGVKLPLGALKDHINKCKRPSPPISPLTPSPVRSPTPDFPSAFPMSTSHESENLESQGHDVIWIDTEPLIENPDIEQEFVQGAITQSMLETSQPDLRDGEISGSVIPYSVLSGAIRSLQSELKDPFDNPMCLEVRCDCILTDSLREARKKKFDPRKHMKVNFIGEGAIDHGGPRCEFFRLLALKSSEEFFHGKPHCKFFANDVIALQQNQFYHLGLYAAMSIAHGGGGFPFLSKAVYSYISSGKYTDIEVDSDDIPDATVKFAIQKIKRAEDTVQLQAALAVDEIQDLLLQTGFKKPIAILTVADKEELSSAIVDFHLMAKVKCIMDQFMEGLKLWDY